MTGRPRIYEEPRVQLSFRMAEAKANEMLDHKPAAESRSSFLERIVQAGLVALGLATSTGEIPHAPEHTVPALRAADTRPQGQDDPIVRGAPEAAEPAPIREAVCDGVRDTNPPRADDRGHLRGVAAGVDLWRQLETPLRQAVGDENYDVWLSTLRVGRCDLLGLELQAPNEAMRRDLDDRFKEVLQAVLARGGQPKAVSFVVAPRSVAVQDKAPETNRDAKPEKSAREKLLARIPEQLRAEDTVLLDIEVRREELDKLNPGSTAVASAKAELVKRFWDRIHWIAQRLADGTHPWLKGRRLWGTDPYRRHA